MWLRMLFCSVLVLKFEELSGVTVDYWYMYVYVVETTACMSVFLAVTVRVCCCFFSPRSMSTLLMKKSSSYNPSICRDRPRKARYIKFEFVAINVDHQMYAVTNNEQFHTKRTYLV